MEKFYREGQIFNDSQDLLQEDVQNIVTDGQADSAERMVASAAYSPTLTTSVMGITTGLVLTAGVGTISVGIGKAYDLDGMIIENTGTVAAVTGVVAGNVGKWVLLSGVEADDTTTTRQNYVGAVAATRRKITVTLSISTTIPGGGNLVESGCIVLGKITAWDGGAGKPILGARASATTGAGQLMPGTLAVPVYGYAGNKYYYWFEAEEGSSAPTVSYFTNALTTGDHYLRVKIPTIGATVNPTCLNSSVYSAILAAGYPYQFTNDATLFDYGWIATSYVNFTTGSDYRQYFQTKVGSYGLSDSYRLSPDDPYTQHLNSLGALPSTPTTNNPHGQILDDLDAGTGTDIKSLKKHRRYDHVNLSGISRGSDNTFLGTTVVTNVATIQDSVLATDRAVINGAEVTALTNGYSFSGTAATTEVYESGVMETGAGYSKVVANYGTGSGLIDAASGLPILAIIDKHPNLAIAENLELVKSGASYMATLGAGTAVSVAGVSTIRIVDENGYWVDVQRQISPADGTYTTNITFYASELISTLPSAIVLWQGERLAGANFYAVITEKRRYGTDSIKNDIYTQLGDNLDYAVRFEGNSLLNSATSGLIPFEVDYRGVTYSIPAQAIGSISAVIGTNKYLVQRFTDNVSATPALINGNTETMIINYSDWNRQTDVLLGMVTTAAGPVISSGTYFKAVSTKNNSYNTLRVGITAWNIDDALAYIEAAQTWFPTVTFNIEFISSAAHTVAKTRIYAISRLNVYGNNFTWTGAIQLFTLIPTTIQATGAGAQIKCFDVNFGQALKFIGLSTNASENFSFERCGLTDIYAAPNYFIQTLAAQATVNFRDFKAVITGTGSYRLVWNRAGNTYVHNDNPSIAGIATQSLYVTYTDQLLASTPNTVVVENKGAILYGDYYVGVEAGLAIKKMGQTWAASNIGVEANLSAGVLKLLMVELFDNEISFSNTDFIKTTLSGAATQDVTVIAKGNNISTTNVTGSNFINLTPASGTIAGSIDVCDNNFVVVADANFKILLAATDALVYAGPMKFSDNRVESTATSTGVFCIAYATTGTYRAIVTSGVQINNNTVWGMGCRVYVRSGGGTAEEAIEINGLYLQAAKTNTASKSLINFRGNWVSISDVKEVENIYITNLRNDMNINWIVAGCQKTKESDNDNFINLELDASFVSAIRVMINGTYSVFTTGTSSKFSVDYNDNAASASSLAMYFMNGIQINGDSAMVDSSGAFITGATAITGNNWHQVV